MNKSTNNTKTEDIDSKVEKPSVKEKQPVIMAKVPKKSISEQLSDLKKFNVQMFKPYIIIIVNAFVITAVILGLVLPQYTKFQQIRETRERKDETLKKVQANAEYLQSLAGLSAELENNIAIARDALPVEDDTPIFLNTLLQIAQDTEVEVGNLSLAGISEPGEKNAVGTISTNIKVSGLNENVLQFLRALENSRRIISVEDFRVNIDYEMGEDKTLSLVSKSDAEYTLNLNVNGYYLPEMGDKGLSVDAMSKRQPLESVITKLSTMSMYEAGNVRIEIGNKDPFFEGQEVEIGVDVITGEVVNPESNDASGFSAE